VMAWESPPGDGPPWQDRVLVQNVPIRGVLPEPVPVPDGGNVNLGGLPTTFTVSDPRHEDESTALARQIRDLPPGDPKADELKAKLRAVLERTFAERQATQKKELATLHERLRSLEQTLTRREALKDQIITRRLDALVDADRELWEDTIRPEPNPVRGRLPGLPGSTAPMSEPNQGLPLLAPGTTRYPVPSLTPVSPTGTRPPSAANPNSFAPSPATTAAPATPANTPAVAPADPSAKQDLSRATVLSLLRSIQRSETETNRASTLKEKGAVSDAELERLKLEHRFQLELLKALRAEAAARQKILELSLRKAKLHADSAMAEMTRTQELVKRNAASITEFEKTRLEAESAKIDLEKAQLELDEHQKVLEIFPSEEPKTDPNPTEDPVPEEAQPTRN
jgi:hypothetical protein